MIEAITQIIKIFTQYHSVFVEGLVGTLWISLVTVFFGSIVGFLTALLKLSRVKLLQMISTVYIEIVRGTPILLQLYFFWLWLPKIVPLELSNLQCVVVALIFNAGAYVSEIIRAGIMAVDVGQFEAARSLGMSNKNMMVKIIMPQAIKNILPALCNEFISMIKQTSLASVFFVGELTTAFKTVQTASFLAIPPLVIVGIIYFIVTFVLSKLITRLERRLRRNERTTSFAG